MCQKKVMRKRSHDSLGDEPPKKRISRGSHALPKRIAPGEVLTDLTGKQWKLGKVIGHGGFGEIYFASDNIHDCVKNDAPYVVKIESHNNGPLFVEINCFLRIAKNEMIEQWKEERNMKYLGMPHYIASGSHEIDNEKVRFLVLPRYDQDLEELLNKNNKFNLKTVVVIATQILDVLEYIHSKGYVHCDIKASNLLHSIRKSAVIKSPQNQGCKPTYDLFQYRFQNPPRSCKAVVNYNIYNKSLRPKKVVNYCESDDDLDTIFESVVPKIQENEIEMSEIKNGHIYLLDYGLASKYRLSNGQHKQYCHDERKAHAGTILFCSLDAHLGAQSRRSDLESLGYNMIYWLTSKLPWNDDVDSPETVQSKKQKYFQDLDKFLVYCFGEYPKFLYEYFNYVKTLTFESKPDYKYCKKLLQNALRDYGYKKDGYLDFDNVEGWGTLEQKNIKKKTENFSKKNVAHSIVRSPSTSNALIKKPLLRGNKTEKTGLKKLNWSKILSDPEEILRQSNKIQKHPEVINKPRDRKMSEPSDNSLQNLDIWKLNPTYAMVYVFKKSRDRNGNYNVPLKNGRGDSYICENEDGNTPAMKMVLSKMHQRKIDEVNAYASISPRKNKIVKSNIKKSTTELRRTKTSSFVKEIKRKTKSARVLRGYGLRG